jgi:hypothetical protein
LAIDLPYCIRLRCTKGSVAIHTTTTPTPPATNPITGLHFPSPNFSIYYFEMHTPSFLIRVIFNFQKEGWALAKNSQILLRIGRNLQIS